MDNDIKRRKKEVIIKACAVLCIGLLYAFVYINTDLKIPCLFYEATGLLCPGCGVSAMCVSLLRLDFKAAFLYNPAIMLALPILILLIVLIILKYIRTGSFKLKKWQSFAVWALIAYFILYGIIRNNNF